MAQKNKIIIGLVGKKGSGKDLFWSYLTLFDFLVINEKDCTNLISSRVKQIKSSRILIETLEKWGIPVTRENMQKLPQGMENMFGKGTLSNAVYPLILNCDAPIVVFDAVRWLTDVEMLRRFSPSFLVYIVADEKIRYQRIKNRGEKPEEKNLPFKQFQKEEGVSTEILIDQLGAMADLKIENNGTPEQFTKEIEKFYDKYLKAAI